jgi:hypothetical protein
MTLGIDIYVEPEYRGEGIGGIAMADEKGIS